MLENIKNYKRLFHHRGFRLLINYIWVRAYKNYGTVAIVRDDDYIGYIADHGYKRAEKEGLELFSSEEKFDEYFFSFKEFQDEMIKFFRNLSDSNIDKKTAKEVFEYCEKALFLYKKTEFLFTDRPYLESKKKINPFLNKNLDKFKNIKFPARDFLNLIFIGKSSFLYNVLKNIGKKFSVSPEKLLQYTPDEIINLYDSFNNKLPEEIIVARGKANIVLDDKGVVRIWWGEEAEKDIVNFFQGQKSSLIIKGQIANPGIVQGRAKVLRPGYDDFHIIGEAIKKMKQGEILISETTSPELLVACNKAGAIVTDQGGLISHAAIISRELGIPCIVGAGNATKVLKDGDLVEVDADKGIVRVLNKK